MLATFISQAGWGLPFYLLALYGVICYFNLSKQEDKPHGITWSPLQTVSITLAIYFFSQIIAGLLIYIYPLSRHWDGARINTWLQQSVVGQFLLVLFVEAIVVAMLWYFLRRRHASFKTVGLKKSSNWLRDVIYVILGFGVYFLLYVVLLTIVRHIVYINVNQPQQLGFNNVQGIGALTMVFVSLVLLPPIAEEILVRGFLYSGLKKGLPIVWAVLVTSALFAIAHLEAGSGAPLLWVAAIDTFTLSLVLIYLREKTGSLWASIGLHMLKNGVAFLSLYILKLK